ncbi:MAG: hypothetical protein DHS20C15_09500 [Planctomycetota bacterium]|nr:MAG: hypothetical protein DHS20C15_09500 [Planctomycetota bacterium]
MSGLFTRSLIAGLLFTGVAPAAGPVVAEPSPAADPVAADAKGGVFVLGVDGMDPVVLQRFIDEGKMPNFKALAADGSFQELGTSNPPQSPVAWSNFVTGMNPGGHGIYDFIHRDPKTYLPMASATPPPSGNEPFTPNLFGFCLPLWGADEFVNNRSGTPFWDHLIEAGVPTEVYRMPGNFPPTPSEALTLTGMGTDDLRATNGQYFWYTDELVVGQHLKAELTIVQLEDTDDDGVRETMSDVLKGPADSMHCNPAKHDLEIPLKLWIDRENGSAWVQAGDSDGIVPIGGWSDWMTVSFDAIGGGMMPLEGIVRFYLKSVEPFRLYVSPINFSPTAPATPLTTPSDDALVELKKELGNFYTQGMPEETNALKDGLFDDDDFVKQVQLVHDDGHAMLDLALRRFDPGDTSFVYLSDIDLQCHMLWHHADIKEPERTGTHPAYKAAIADRHAKHLEDFYVGVDAVLGNVRDRLPSEAMLIVMSDHGFQPFTRKFNLNAWLRDEGYLAMDTEKTEGKTFGKQGDIDYAASRAYGYGFNGIYLNRDGRERDGMLSASDARALSDEIISKLEALVDPENGKRPVLNAYRADEVYSGDRLAEAPDIIVGYAAGYGCSETSTLGDVDEIQLYDNTGGDFTGNHLMDPSVVPGVLLTNRKLARDGHDLTDMTATLLDYYDLTVPAEMVGTSILD